MGRRTVAAVLLIESGLNPDTIKSMLNQSFWDFEFFIYDLSGSIDIQNEIQKYHDSRIKLSSCKDRKPSGFYLQHAISRTRADFIARIDPYCISNKDRITTQVEYLEENKEIGILSSQIALNKVPIMPSYISSNEEHRIYLLKGNTILTGTSMIRKNAVDRHSLQYDQLLGSASEYKLYIEASLNGIQIETLHDVLALQETRKLPSQSSATGDYTRELNIIRALYADFFFSGVSRNWLLYLSFISGKRNENFSFKDYEKLARALIKENTRLSVFSMKCFNHFITDLLFQLKGSQIEF